MQLWGTKNNSKTNAYLKSICEEQDSTITLEVTWFFDNFMDDEHRTELSDNE